MSERPEPMVPADCDLRKLDWFPLYHRRLIGSVWWSKASDLARSRTVDLWVYAFQQVPAASLPDKDVDLADAAGFGRDLKAWRKAKDEIMAPWALCSDGRYYHPTLAEVAAEAWDRVLKARVGNNERMQRLRDRKRAVRHAEKAAGHGVTGRGVTGGDGGGHGCDTPPSHGVTRSRHIREIPLTGSYEPSSGGVGEGDLFLLDEPVTPSPKPPKPPKPPAPPPPVEEAFARYLALAERCGLAKPKSLDEDRRKRIAARLKDGGLEGWTEALAAVERNRWTQGAGPRGWKADLDFIVQLKSFRRLREGYYDQFDTGNERGKPQATGADRRRHDRDENHRRSHAGALAAVERCRERG